MLDSVGEELPALRVPQLGEGLALIGIDRRIGRNNNTAKA